MSPRAKQSRFGDIRVIPLHVDHFECQIEEASSQNEND
jgi:hypothetical protein